MRPPLLHRAPLLDRSGSRGWSLVRGLLRQVRSASPDGDRRIGVESARGRVEPKVIRDLREALDVANRRLDRIEAKAEFDRRLEQGR